MRALGLGRGLRQFLDGGFASSSPSIVTCNHIPLVAPLVAVLACVTPLQTDSRRQSSATASLRLENSEKYDLQTSSALWSSSFRRRTYSNVQSDLRQIYPSQRGFNRFSFNGKCCTGQNAHQSQVYRKSSSQASRSEARLQEEPSNEIDSRQADQPAVQPLPATQLQVEDVVKHPALIVTRNVEWGTVILGFEQANKYTVLDQDGNVVALLAEDMGGLGKEVGRQFLRTRRSFTATILSPEGQVVLRLRRPMYFINSTIYVEDGDGEVIGEVRQRFHVWQRNYDIYLDRQQVAVINSPLLAWEFAVRDAHGGVLALIDRNFQGFGKELFTDAGKYVIHFGDRPAAAAEQAANIVQAAHPDKPRPDVTALARIRTEIAVIPTSTGNQLEVVRPLSIDERTLILATAVSIDFDYFSQHSHGSGLLPFGLMPFPGAPPVPYPSEGGEGADVSPAGTEGSEGPSGGAGGETLDSGEGDFQQEDFGDQNRDFGLGEDQGFEDMDDDAGWSSGMGDGDAGGEGGAFGSLFELGRGLFGNDD